MRKIIILSLIIKAVTFTSNGLNYKEPESVKRFFYEPQVRTQTPSIRPGRKEFTTQREMLDYLGAIHTTNDNTIVDLLGPTSGGNYLPVILITRKKMYTKEKPTVMLIAQQHGNEPMGCDVLLAMVNRVAKGDLNYLLDRINVIIMPRINPDGAKKFTRDSGERKDINADHASLSTKEAQSVEEIYMKYRPEVFVDIHEYISDLKSYSNILEGGAVPYNDLMILSPTNPNYSKNLDAYAKKTLLEIKRIENQSSYNVDYYYNPFVKPKNGNPLTLYQATGSPKLARNMYGLKGSLSYLIELRGRNIGFENVKRRLESGSLAAEKIMKNLYDNSEEIKKLLIIQRNSQDEPVKKSSDLVIKNGLIKLIDVSKGIVVDEHCIKIKEASVVEN